MTTALRQRLLLRMADPHAVLQRQLGICGVVLVSLLIFLRPDINASSDGLVLIAVALVLAATAAPLLLPPHGRPRAMLLAIPFADLIAVGLLRSTAGGGVSLFSTLLVLPVISLGIERGRLPVLLATAGCAGVIGIPLSLGSGGDDWLRVVTTPLVLTLTAMTVHVLSSRLRDRVRSENWLRREQEMLLHEAKQHAAATVEVAALLRQSAALMSSVVDAVTEQFVIATDADGRIEVFNRGAQRMLDMTADDALGRPITGSLGDRFVQHRPPSADVPDAGPLTMSAVGFPVLVSDARGGRAAASAWVYQRIGGATVTIEMSITVRHDALGDVDGFLIVGTDVSEAYEQARLKDEFISLVSHELRTPLSSIVGYLELLSDDEEQPLTTEQQHYLSIVDRNAHRLLRLVGDLLFTASLEAGKPNLEMVEVDLDTVATASVVSARPAADGAGITVSLVVPEDPLTVLGDSTRLGQICDNLLSNAIKFTPRGGTVEVLLSTGGSTPDLDRPTAQLAVRDTGLGIPAAELENLFSRFFRTSTATAHAVPGIGLGLSISRAIAIAHGGSIAVTSPPGEGATFTVVLPTVDRAGRCAVSQPAAGVATTARPR